MTLTQRAATWLSHLVQIPSVTPSQSGERSGTPGEEAISQAIASWFRRLGGDVVIHEVLPSRPNVYGLWPGDSEYWIAVDVHVDTVGVEQMTEEPFSGAVHQGKVWGRGAVDTKASLGVILALIEHFQETHQIPRANLLVGATADEEFGATGAPAFASWIIENDIAVSQLVVAEPTLCTPVIGHRGVARLELTFRGEAAHSSQPEKGKNAIVSAAHTVIAFDQEHRRLQTLSPSNLGHGALTTTIIQGGSGANVVPEICTLAVDRRLVDGEDPHEVIDHLYDLARQHSTVPVELERQLCVHAFYQPSDSPWINELVEWSGNPTQIAPYGTNAWAYRTLPGETVVIGPGSIDQAHGPSEWVELSQLEKITQIYANWWGIELS